MTPSFNLLLLLGISFYASPAVDAACWPAKIIAPNCYVCKPHLKVDNCDITKNIHLLFPVGFLSEMISPPTALSHETLDKTERTMFNVASDPRIPQIPASFDSQVDLTQIDFLYRYLNVCYGNKKSLSSLECANAKVGDQYELIKIRRLLLKAPGNPKNQVAYVVFSLISNLESKPKNSFNSKSGDGYKGTWSYIFTRQIAYFNAMVIFARHLQNHNMYDADLIRWAYLQFQNYRFIAMGTTKLNGKTIPQRFNALGAYVSRIYRQNLGKRDIDSSFEIAINGTEEISVEDSQVEAYENEKKRILTQTGYLQDLVNSADSVCKVVLMPDSAAGCITMAVFLMSVDNESAKFVYDSLFSYDRNVSKAKGSIELIHQTCAKWHLSSQCDNAIIAYGATDSTLRTIGEALKEVYNSIAPQK